jgi:hypothetical protein
MEAARVVLKAESGKTEIRERRGKTIGFARHVGGTLISFRRKGSSGFMVRA